MIDFNSLYDFYQEAKLNNGEYLVYEGTDKHRLNINLLSNELVDLTRKFRQHYVKAYHILAPRLNGMIHWVNIKSLGGHFIMKGETYNATYNEFKREVDQVVYFLKLIRLTQNDISAEYEAIETDKSNQLKDNFETELILSNPVTNCNSGEQIQLNF